MKGITRVFQGDLSPVTRGLLLGAIGREGVVHASIASLVSWCAVAGAAGLDSFRHSVRDRSRAAR